MIFLSCRFNLFIPLLKILYGLFISHIGWSTNNLVCDIKDPSLFWPHFSPLSYALDMPSYWLFLKNVVFFRNFVLLYTLFPLPGIHLTLFLLAKYHLFSKTHLWENCQELPSSIKCPFCAPTLTVVFIPSKALLVPHFLACLHYSYFSHVTGDCHSA